MANKSAIKFFLNIVGDGSSTTFTANVLTKPYGFYPPAGSVLVPSFDLTSNLPTDAINLSCSSGQTVTLTSLLLGILTVSLSSAITNGNVEYITGYFTF